MNFFLTFFSAIIIINMIGCGSVPSLDGVKLNLQKEDKKKEKQDPKTDDKTSDKQNKTNTNHPPKVSIKNKPTYKLIRKENSLIKFQVDSSDEDGDLLDYKWQENNVTISTEKNIQKDDFSVGKHKLTLIVTDSKGASSQDSVTFEIVKSNHTNNPPTAVDQNIMTDENKKITFQLNVNDIDGDNLSLNIITPPQHGQITTNFPYITYTPDKNFRGSDKISYKVSDNNSTSNKATVYIKINQINHAPIVNAGEDKKVRVLHAIWINGQANDTDGNITKYEWSENGKFLSNKPSFKYTPKTLGSHILMLTATDNQELSSSDTLTVKVTNKLPLLVIRVEFNNFKFHSNESVWSQKIFGTGSGELNNYYNEISYGNFQFEKAKENQGTKNDGIITISLNEDHPGNSINFQTYLPKIIQKTDNYIDYSQYDLDKNNKISMNELQIMFLFAGGENATGNYPGIWAHASCISNAPTLDGKKLMECGQGTYSIFGERHKIGNKEHDATIGIIAHELAHASFGLVDLYDRDGSSEGIGDFGLMGSGNWGRKTWDEKPGSTPVHMCAWNKIQSKFIEPIEINTSTSITLDESSNQNFKTYKLPTKNKNEYFLLENRGNSGYDKGLFILKNGQDFQGGLMITHIDENIDKYEIANDDETHKLVDIEEASHPVLDTNTSGRGDVYNLYFRGNNDKFTPTTNPNSNLYDGTQSGILIDNISNYGSTMSADINIQGE